MGTIPPSGGRWHENLHLHGNRFAAERLDGTPLALRPDGDRVLVSCRFAGGGTMLVFNLKGQP